MPLPATDTVKARLMDAADVDRTLNRLARQIVEHLDDSPSRGSGEAEPAEPIERLALVGMQTRGVHIARRLRDKIEAFEGIRLPFGVLDTTLYRDDYRKRLRQPIVQPTDIPFDVDDRRLVLVDDVVYTGRTTRAALDAIMDLGRPASVRLLAFIDRGLRELPVAPDFIGRIVPTIAGEEVRVRLTEIDDEDGVWLVEPQPKDKGGA